MGNSLMRGFLQRIKTTKVEQTPPKSPMDSTTPLRDRFAYHWTMIDTEIPYRPEWDATDRADTPDTYISRNDPLLVFTKVGERRRSITPDGRRIIIVGTFYGIIGFIELLPEVEGKDTVIIRDDTGEWLDSGGDIDRMCGEHENIGTLWETLRESSARALPA